LPYEALNKKYDLNTCVFVQLIDLEIMFIY